MMNNKSYIKGFVLMIFAVIVGTSCSFAQSEGTANDANKQQLAPTQSATNWDEIRISSKYPELKEGDEYLYDNPSGKREIKATAGENEKMTLEEPLTKENEPVMQEKKMLYSIKVESNDMPAETIKNK